METNTPSEGAGEGASLVELVDEIVNVSEIDFERLAHSLRAIKVRNRIWVDRYWHTNAMQKAINTLARERGVSKGEIEYEFDQPGGFTHGYVGKNQKFYRFETDARWTFPLVT